MIDTSRLAGCAFLVSFGGLLVTAILLAVVYFELVPDGSYIFAGITVLVFQLPALAMAIATRRQRLGRAALALSSSILVGVAIVLILMTPAAVAGPGVPEVTESPVESSSTSV